MSKPHGPTEATRKGVIVALMAAARGEMKLRSDVLEISGVIDLDVLSKLVYLRPATLATPGQVALVREVVGSYEGRRGWLSATEVDHIIRGNYDHITRTYKGPYASDPRGGGLTTALVNAILRNLIDQGEIEADVLDNGSMRIHGLREVPDAA